MYAQNIVEQRLELACQELKFPLEYHSVSEIETFDRQLALKYEAEYDRARAEAQGAEEPTRVFQISLMRSLCDPTNPRLTKEETWWIQNERHLLMCDCAYFLTRYYHILNDEGFLQRFRFRSGQKIFFNCVAEIESQYLAIEILLAKARQLGMTTVVAGMLLLKAMLHHGANTVTASADTDKTREMVKKILMAYDKIPWYIRPLYTKRAEGEKGYLKFGSIDSGIFFQHGNQTNPIAMGTTVTGYHLSEVSSYADAEDLIDVGLFKAVHPSPRVFGVLESTCKGDTGWWSDNYWKAKSKWQDGKSRLMALFLPFYCAEDMYPNETEKRGHPIPEGWRPDPETRKMIAESELYVQSNPVLAKVLSPGKPWKMPREKAWYWEWNFINYRDDGKEKSWYSEIPHTDRVAFQGSFDNVFGREVIAEVFSQRETRYGVYGIVGQSIEERHEPDPEEFDHSEAIIPVSYKSRKGELYRWELQPLEWQERFRAVDDQNLRDSSEHMGKLFVWLPPEPGFDYSIGVDTSNGIGQDCTVISVFRRGRNPQEPDEQAAEFSWDRVSHVDAYAFTLAIAAYYAKHMESTTRYREPFVAVEQIAAVGDTVQLQMSNMGYSRFMKFTRYDSDPKHMMKSKSHKRGWYSNAWSRPILTDTFVTWVQNGWVKLNSPYTIYQCDHWEVHILGSGKSKFEHNEDTTDDGIFAAAMATFCPNDRKTMADRSVRRLPDSDTRNLPLLDTRTYAGVRVSPDDHREVEDRWAGSELSRYI